MTQPTHIYKHSGAGTDWAVDICADMLVAAGAVHVQVNAAGDLALRGGYFDPDVPGIKPWKIGVVNPDNRTEVMKILHGAINSRGVSPTSHLRYCP